MESLYLNIYEELKKYPLLNHIRENLKIEISNNDFVILLEKYIKKNNLPNLTKFFILKNTTNIISENFVLIFSKLKLITLISETKDFFDYYLLGFRKKKIGFYIDINEKHNGFLELYDIITVFEILENDIIILKKNLSLKKNLIFYKEKSENEMIFKGLFLDNKTELTPELSMSIIKELKIQTCFDEIELPLKKFDDYNDNVNKMIFWFNNNQTLTDEYNDRNPNLDDFIFCIKNENKIEINLNIDYFFDIEVYKIRNLVLDIFKHCIKNIEYDIDLFFKNNNNFLKKINNNMYLKKINQDELLKNKDIYDYYEVINEDDNNLIKFISNNNNINFGKNILILKKDTKLNKEILYEKIIEFENVFYKKLEIYFKELNTKKLY